MRGRLDRGDWVKNFTPQYPYYEYMYREANAWESSFFAPHDTDGLIGLYKSHADFEQHLDSLFTSLGIKTTSRRTSIPSSANTARETSPTTVSPSCITL
jgi:putative alpha-1,2-mannosidase